MWTQNSRRAVPTQQVQPTGNSIRITVTCRCRPESDRSFTTVSANLGGQVFHERRPSLHAILAHRIHRRLTSHRAAAIHPRHRPSWERESLEKKTWRREDTLGHCLQLWPKVALITHTRYTTICTRHLKISGTCALDPRRPMPSQTLPMRGACPSFPVLLPFIRPISSLSGDFIPTLDLPAHIDRGTIHHCCNFHH